MFWNCEKKSVGMRSFFSVDIFPVFSFQYRIFFLSFFFYLACHAIFESKQRAWRLFEPDEWKSHVFLLAYLMFVQSTFISIHAREGGGAGLNFPMPHNCCSQILIPQGLPKFINFCLIFYVCLDPLQTCMHLSHIALLNALFNDVSCSLYGGSTMSDRSFQNFIASKSVNPRSLFGLELAIGGVELSNRVNILPGKATFSPLLSYFMNEWNWLKMRYYWWRASWLADSLLYWLLSAPDRQIDLHKHENVFFFLPQVGKYFPDFFLLFVRLQRRAVVWRAVQNWITAIKINLPDENKWTRELFLFGPLCKSPRTADYIAAGWHSAENCFLFGSFLFCVF